jgi:Family of unknown function (DUF6445)
MGMEEAGSRILSCRILKSPQPMFNPHPKIAVLPIDDQHNCYVIDDALLEPDRWVKYAAEYRHAFRIEGFNAYPGPELRMPEGVSQRLDEFFMQHIRSLLGARRTLRMYSRLAMATLASEALAPPQWICHRDRMGVPIDQCVAASVLYLFKDEALGGTNFFRPLREDREIDVLVHESGALSREAFADKYGLRAGYLTESNAYFEKIFTVPARWNRLIFYDGSRFHCSNISAPERLSDDPRTGRLTLNGFFTCRRNSS